MIRWLYRQWRRLRRLVRGKRRRALALKLEALETLAEVRQEAEERVRESGELFLEWDTWRQLQAQRARHGRPQADAAPGAREPDGAAPVLDAYEDGTCWRVWCRYCHVWHTHSRGAGHRVAHCLVAESPYRQTGYTLRDAGPFTAARRRQEECGDR